jgi:hypothetical protein
MPKVRPFTDQNDVHSGWGIFCPACECVHIFDNRWTFNGDEEKPTFSPSMLVYEHPYADDIRPRCHSFVTDGKIAFCEDSGHEYAGQTLDLPDYHDIEEGECVDCKDCIKAAECKARKRNPSILGCLNGRTS